MELGKRGIIRGLFAPTNAPSCIAMNLRRYLTGERTSFIGLDQSVSTAATAAGGAL
jgi:hypothetical protein